MKGGDPLLDRVYVEIGNVCNLKCSFCPGTKRAERVMSVSEFEEVCKKIAGKCENVFLHVMGEPLYHPDIEEILSTAEKYSLKISLTTNGTLLSSRRDVLLRYAPILHRVSISLHAPEGNGRSIGKGYLSSAISFAKQITPLGVNVIFRLWNLDTDERAGQNSENSVIEDELHREYPDEWARRYSGYRLAYRTFLEYDGIFVWPSESSAEGSEQGRCHALKQQIAILADGTVVPCCLDSDGNIPLGNIFDSELGEILSSDTAVKIARGFATGKVVHPFCKKCTYRERFSR